MAILHHKETKIQSVLGRLPKTYTHEQFVDMFIRLYSKDWGKIKSAFIKQSQDREPGVVINMPKPDLYLKQLLTIYLTSNPPQVESVVAKKAEIVEAVVAKEKLPVKKETPNADDLLKVTKKPKDVAKKKVASDKKSESILKSKTPAKKKLDDNEIAKPVKTEKKAKVISKKSIKADETDELPKKVKATPKSKIEEDKPGKKTASKK